MNFPLFQVSARLFRTQSTIILSRQLSLLSTFYTHRRSFPFSKSFPLSRSFPLSSLYTTRGLSFQSEKRFNPSIYNRIKHIITLAISRFKEAGRIRQEAYFADSSSESSDFTVNGNNRASKDFYSYFKFKTIISDFLTNRTNLGRNRPNYIELLSNIGHIGIWSILILTGLDIIGIHVRPLLGGAGIIGILAGISANKIGANYASGLQLLMNSPFNIGDTISVGSDSNKVTGKVVEIDLSAVKLKCEDGHCCYVPHSSISGYPIHVLSSESDTIPKIFDDNK